MNKKIWGGVIGWGVLVICFGIASQNVASALTNTRAGVASGEEMVIFLAGGIVATLIGIVGLTGSMYRCVRITPRIRTRARCFDF
ncbi:MAG TPA: hypothetical protein VGU61_06740 [Noviherbaspirillum sp.]|uniref:hypothetical protein n=1 Tax=Noviherbaspirillum sp. TaxID=1926288 RepID=UPI002DDD0948|nr:hypothetical protein [Noviherbaspirillum sp.]HEV2609946.1 hypothetical protein [Noviherbaspirillum sp.]